MLSLRCIWIVRKYVFISFKPFYIKISTEWLTTVQSALGGERVNEPIRLKRVIRQVNDNYWMRRKGRKKMLSKIFNLISFQ